jgi:hypothetical protein
MKNFIKSICIGLLFLPLTTSQASIGMELPTIVCCLTNPDIICAVVEIRDFPGAEPRRVVVNGVQVPCVSW